jgi:hypothetical protein
MNRSKFFAAAGALALLATLSACADDDDATAYGPPHDFTYNANTWRVADDRAGGRISVTATNPRLAGLGTQAYARYPVGTLPAAEFRAAAEGWFVTTGRFCTPTAAGEPTSNTMEFRYSCWQPN